MWWYKELKHEILNASFGVRCDWDHLDEKGMDDVGLFLCGPGQLGEGG